MAALPAIAQDSGQYRSCKNKAQTQSEMNVCASNEAARVDAQLNEMYRKLLTQAAKQEGAVVKIQSAEKAWIIYRDAFVDAMYPARDKQAEYGSVFPMEVDLLRAKLTRQHISALKALLQHYSGASH